LRYPLIGPTRSNTRSDATADPVKLVLPVQVVTQTFCAADPSDD